MKIPSYWTNPKYFACNILERCCFIRDGVLKTYVLFLELLFCNVFNDVRTCVLCCCCCSWTDVIRRRGGVSTLLQIFFELQKWGRECSSSSTSGECAVSSKRSQSSVPVLGSPSTTHYLPSFHMFSFCHVISEIDVRVVKTYTTTQKKY